MDSFPQTPAPEVYRPGQYVGQYELVSMIGGGGMGEVWQARDHSFGRQVAIKLLLPEYAGDEERLLRFERDTRLAGILNHPNVLAVHAIGGDNGRPYLVTELLAGESLRTRLKRCPLPAPHAIEIGAQIATGLAAAHDRGLIHRDLKPENVFIASDGCVKILDFGQANLSLFQSTMDHPVTGSGSPSGAPHHMSPEQAQGREVDHRSDIFALGTIVYEMFAGRPAFGGESPLAVMMAILNTQPPEIQNASPALRKIVGRCLAKNPADRFQSARDLAFQLELLQESAEQPAVEPQPAPAPFRRTRALEPEEAPAQAPPVKGHSPMILIAGVALATIAVVVTSYLLGRSDARGREKVAAPAAADAKSVPPAAAGSVPQTAATNSPAPMRTAPEPAPLPFPLPPPVKNVPAKTPAAPPPATPPPAAQAPAPGAIATPPSAPRTSANTVEVALNTEPPGAAIRLDGSPEPVCVTPCVVKAAPGTHTLAFARDGFRNIRSEYRFAPGMSGPPPIHLIAATGTVMLQSEPTGAEIFVGEVKLGKRTPAQLTLPPGSHRITLEKNGVRRFSTVEVKDGDIRYLSVAFTP